MIADMTAPNGGFIPRNQTQQAGSYQPLQQNDAGDAMEMRQQVQQQSRSQPGYDYQPVQQGEVEEGVGGQHLSREEAMQRRYEQSGPSSPITESSSAAAVRQGKQREGNGPNGETHPAFRNDPDAIATAM